MPIIQLDFRQAPPSKGGSALPLVDDGPYVMQVTSVDEKQSQAGNNMIVVTSMIADRPEVGEFNDYFSPVPPAPGDNLNGLRKFHGFLLSAGFTPPEQAKLNTDKIVGRKFTANLRKEAMQATAQYPNPREVSKIYSYEFATPATSPVAKNGAAAAVVGQNNGTGDGTSAASKAPATPPATEAVSEAPTAPTEGVTVDDSDEDIFE